MPRRLLKNLAQREPSDRLVNFVLVVVALLMLSLFVLAVWTLREAGSGSATAQQLADNNEVASCRVLWSDDVELARSEFLISLGTIQVHVAEGLEAVATGDDKELGRILGLLAEARQSVLVRQRALSAAVVERQEASELALSDPAEFLVRCAERTGGQ